MSTSAINWVRTKNKKLRHYFVNIMNLSGSPGLTDLAKHVIRLTSDKPVRSKLFPLPLMSRERVCEEVRRMQETGIIEPSTSPYLPPIVIVKKKSGSNRFCIDFRAVNRLTLFDAETIPNEDIFMQLAYSRYMSKCDLCKGYWQLPHNEITKCIKVFKTSLGLFQCLLGWSTPQPVFVV